MEDYLEELFVDYGDLPEEDLKKYLLRSSLSSASDGQGGDELPFLYMALPKLKKLRKLLRQEAQFEWLGDSLLKLSAILYSNITECVDLNVKLIACHLFLHLSHCPLAAVSGISTTYVLKNICSVIQKCLVDALSGRTHGKKPQLEEDGAAEDGNGSKDLDPTILHSLLQDYQIYLPLYSNRTEEYLLDAFADTLATAVCLTSVKEEYLDALSLAKGSLAIFALRNESTLSATYRSLLPILTLVGRDPRLPDSSKGRLLCHDACLEVVLAVVSSSQQVVPKKRADESRRQSRRVSIESADGEDEEVPSSSEPVNFHGISMPFVCAIGFAQRMMMTSSEKMIPRAQLIQSLLRVTTAVHEGDANFESLRALFQAKQLQQRKRSKPKKGKTDRGRGQQQQQEEDEEDLEEDPRTQHSDALKGLLSPQQTKDSDLHQRSLSTERLLSFIAKLSKSAKLNHRSLCLDLASSILAADWFWQRHAAASASETQQQHSTGVEEMIEILITRCSDVTATVRCRALGALSDLLEFIQKLSSSNNLTTDKNKSDLIARVHSLIMGSGLSKSLLDTLRDLCLDDKPLVKAKAISIFGMMFAVEWPATNSNLITSSTAKLLYLTDDDLGLIADRCTDNSVAVRKQAVTTLTQLLLCRCTDSSLQHLWIESVLPLIHDPEATIQAKICQGVVDILLLGTIAPSSSPEFQATWSLCSKISELGSIKFLKSALSFLKKTAGGAGSSSSSSSSASGGGLMGTLEKYLVDIFAAVRAACSLLGDDQRDAMEQQEQEEEQEISSMSDLRSADLETISRGGWVLLEALVSQNIKPAVSMSGKGSGKSNGSKDSRRLISAEFVLQCWEKKQSLKSAEAALVFDELDTRMLQVMARVPLQRDGQEQGQGQGLDKRALSQQLMAVICAGQSDTQSIAAAVSVIFSFAQLSQSNSNDMYDLEWLQIHTGVLFNCIHRTFHQHLAMTAQEADAEAEEELLFQDSRIALVSPPLSSSFSQSSVCNALFLLGELALLGFSMEEDEDTYKLRSYEPSLPAVFLSETHTSASASTSTSHSFRIETPAMLVLMTQTLMGYSKFSIDSGPHSNSNGHSLHSSFASVNSSLTQDTFVERENSSRIRAQAFITMGKLCLRSRQRARDHVTIFLREIQTGGGSGRGGGGGGGGGNSAVRSNAILVLGDLCVRFTNLVDRHVGSMAMCLQDPDALVRRHSFILLTQLLLQDYLKWRGMLLFRFLVTILDEDEEMAGLARYVLKHTLQLKYPGFIVQNFTECMIVLNNCTDHVTYQTMAALGSDGSGGGDSSSGSGSGSGVVVSMEGIDLHGARGQEKRRRVYQFMLEDISEEDKIQITANIAQDIFSYALDFPIKRTAAATAAKGPRQGQGQGQLQGSVDPVLPLEHALIDAFQILQSPLLKIGKKSTAGGGGGDGEDGAGDETDLSAGGGGGGSESTQAAAAAADLKSSFQKAKHKVLKKLSLQHLIDHLLPLISSLKHLLEATQSPVQRALMEYLVFVTRSNKTEVAQALASDPTLKEEIEYDLKVFEKEKQSEAQRKEILAAERAVLELELSTARKLPTPRHPSSSSAASASGSVSSAALLLSSPLSVKRESSESGTQRLSLSGGRGRGGAMIATPVLKKSSEKKGRTSFSAGGSEIQIQSNSQSQRHKRTPSVDLRALDTEDDFTLRMLSQSQSYQPQGEELSAEEERAVTKRRYPPLSPFLTSPPQTQALTSLPSDLPPPHRRWSVSAETLEMPSDSETTAPALNATPTAAAAPKKRSHCKENHEINATAAAAPPLVLSAGLPSGDSFQSPVKKKKKPSQAAEPESSASSLSLTGLGQLAALRQQDRKSSVAGESSKGAKKQKGVSASRKRGSGDVLGSLK